MLKKFLLLLLFFTLLFSSAFADITPLKVTFINVNHGDYILIQTPDDGIKWISTNQVGYE